MVFDAPFDFAEAVRIAQERDVLPTSAGSAEIRKTFASAVRRQSIFSARTNSATYLQKVKTITEEYAAGRMDLGKARLLLRATLKELGYDPKTGFQDQTDIPPAEAGSLQDLSSETRLDLVIRTNARMALNRGYIEAWQDEDQRHAYPAWELVRIYNREVPRGQRKTKAGLVDDPGNDWPSRWEDAGGRFTNDGRMIARVDDPVWSLLGSSLIFDDGLDNPYPPFAFNSGFGLRAVDRREAIAAGVIAGDDVVGEPDGVTMPATKPTIGKAPKPEKLATRFDVDILKQLRASLDKSLAGWDSGATLAAELKTARGGAK